MDADYARNLDATGAPISQFHHALFVLVTVISTPRGRAVVDGGLKALAADSGPPTVPDHPHLTFAFGGDEHGVLTCSDGSEETGLKVGDQVRLIPGHVDPTVNLYDSMLLLQGNEVRDVLHVTARGPGL
mmetsp:Transcript_64717/g.140978  ORF Transcript_64717/g.140978 Transcript_64717/m.140978 type:complete len:129 (-) Transcript_64717:247-633(-)